MEQLGIGQLHWSTANYQPLQERALWDGLVALYDQVSTLQQYSAVYITMCQYTRNWIKACAAQGLDGGSTFAKFSLLLQGSAASWSRCA